nr:hypothetical protein [Leptospira weilii]
MKRIGLREIGLFQHPELPTEHSLSEHVLYQITHSEWMELRIYDGFAFERRSAPFVKSYIP